MAIKELQTRIALKYDLYSAWTSAPGKDLVLLKGELGICEIPSANTDSHVAPTVLFKVGDGSKTFEKLPWASAKAADVYSWAKASEVKRDGKKLVFVGGAADGSNLEVAFDYVTLAEVQAITNGLASRIEALEGKFTGENDVQSQINALDGRLDVIEGEAEGSVKKALADAKAYTNEREVEIKKYADQAEADAISAAETASEAKVATERARITAVEGRLDVIEGEGEGSVKKALADAKSYADQAELDAVASAKTYTDNREAAIKTAYEAYADQAEVDAKAYADAELKKVVDAQAAADAAQNTEIGKKLDKTTYEAYIAGKAMSDAELKAYADDKASAAQGAAEATAAADAAAKVKALADGQVETNRAAIAAMDTAYKAADTALGNRITTIEGKLADVTNVMDFRGAVEALPAVAGYQNGDVIVVTAGDDKGKEYVLSDGAWVEFGNTDANAAAISGLQGRMDTAEGEIDALQTAVTTTLPAADAALGTRIDNVITAYKAADTETLNSAKKYAEDEADAAEAAAKSHAETKATAAQTAAEATAKAYTDGQVDILKAADQALQTAVNAKLATEDFNSWKSGHENDHAAKATAISAEIDADVAAEAALREAADKAINDKIGGSYSSSATVHAAIEAVKSTANTAASDLAALTTRVGTAESNITTLQGIVNDASKGNAQLRTDVNALQELTGANGAIRTEIAAAKKAGDDAAAAVDALSKGQVATNKANIEAIQSDYLKAADVYVFNCGTSTTVVHEA